MSDILYHIGMDKRQQLECAKLLEAAARRLRRYAVKPKRDKREQALAIQATRLLVERALEKMPPMDVR